MERFIEELISNPEEVETIGQWLGIAYANERRKNMELRNYIAELRERLDEANQVIDDLVNEEYDFEDDCYFEPEFEGNPKDCELPDIEPDEYSEYWSGIFTEMLGCPVKFTTTAYFGWL